MLAPGPGATIDRIAIRRAPALVWVMIRRTGGGPDADGLDLHALYEGACPRLDGASEGSSQIVSVRMDGGLIVVPWCGQILLTGGAGHYEWQLVQEEFRGPYAPRLHWLSRWAPADTRFEVPNYHTRICSLNGTIAVTGPSGETWLLDGSPKPVTPGMLLVVNDDARIATGWMG